MQNAVNFKYYKNLLIIFYLAALSEGILRKWIIPSLATPIFFLKYLIAYLIFLLFLIHKEKIKLNNYPFIGTTLFFLFYCLLQIINFDVTDDIRVFFIGFTIHTCFIILSLIIPFVITSKKHISKIINIVSYICLPIFILGTIQYFSPYDSPINKYVESNEGNYDLVGGYVRITTIFSYIFAYQVFLNFILLLLFFQVINITKLSLKNILLLFTFFLGLVNALMTGSRGLVFMSIIQFTIIFIVNSFTLSFSSLVSYVLKFFALIFLSVIMLLNNETAKTSLEAFLSRVEGNSDIGNRVEDTFSYFQFANQSGLIGFGIGTSYAGSASFITERHRMPVYWEEEPERLVIELGLIGFFVIFIMRATVFLFAIKTFFLLKDKWLKLLALVILTHQIPSVLIFNQVTFNWVENIIYWTEIGFLVSINNIYLNEESTSHSISPR